MSQKSATAVDAHVGRRIRSRRQVMGISQTELGERLGITFQQIQKYEKGGNRISASRLLDVAAALDVPVSYFYEGLDGAEGSTQSLLIDREAADLLRAFNAVTDKNMRRAILSVAQAASRESPARPGEAGRALLKGPRRKAALSEG